MNIKLLYLFLLLLIQISPQNYNWDALNIFVSKRVETVALHACA